MPTPRLLFDSLLPSRCLLCEGGVQGRRPLCSGCMAGLPWLRHACQRCALPMTDAATLCRQCLQQPPAFAGAVCAFRYAAPVDGLLNHYKHHGQLSNGYWLAHALADAVAEREAWPDVIVPVPLHWRRLQQRGFDQALEIARVLARRLGLPMRAAVQRQRHTSSQQGLSREQRQHNLAGAFRLAPELLAGCRSVALVDDVLTTGSTATALTGLLQQAGIDTVHVWAIARTP